MTDPSPSSDLGPVIEKSIRCSACGGLVQGLLDTTNVLHAVCGGGKNDPPFPKEMLRECPGRELPIRRLRPQEFGPEYVAHLERRGREELKSRVAALLRGIEWRGADECGGSECPSCREMGGFSRAEFNRHAPECALAALLKECES